MTFFIQTDATGGGAGAVDANQGAVDLGTIANGDTGLGIGAAVGDLETITYNQTLPGTPPTRLNQLVNTAFTPDYGLGNGPQAVNIIVIPAGTNFMLNDNSLVMNSAGVTLPPANSGLPGANLNGTNNCLVVYDTTQANGSGYCVRRQGTNDYDLGFPNSAILYHELSHALRTCTNTALSLAASGCTASPEEHAAEIDENIMRTQLANAMGTAVELRDDNDHCGAPISQGCPTTCCIVASVASGSPASDLVADLRAFRDGFLRRSEVGFAFFRELFQDYYGFSPQVCTLMAGRPELPPMVLAGFVQPLLSCLNVIRSWSQDGLKTEALGRSFLHEGGGPERRAETLAAIDRAARFWSGEPTVAGDGGTPLAALLAGTARTSDYVYWAFLEPVAIYRQMLAISLDDAAPDAIGRELESLIDDWSAKMPIDPVWASLPRRQLKRELAFVEDTLTRSDGARARFRRRLLDRFGHLPAIRAVAQPGVAHGESA
jgi:hypothetical protein